MFLFLTIPILFACIDYVRIVYEREGTPTGFYWGGLCKRRGFEDTARSPMMADGARMRLCLFDGVAMVGFAGFCGAHEVYGRSTL